MSGKFRPSRPITSAAYHYPIDFPHPTLIYRIMSFITPRAIASSSRSVVVLARTAIPRRVARAAAIPPPRVVIGQRSYATEASEEAKFDPLTIERDSDEVDVCIVGGGPAGLSAAIRLKQLEAEHGREIRVVVLEKGAEIGVSYEPMIDLG